MGYKNFKGPRKKIHFEILSGLSKEKTEVLTNPAEIFSYKLATAVELTSCKMLCGKSSS
jgi:hypothetical protein